MLSLVLLLGAHAAFAAESDPAFEVRVNPSVYRADSFREKGVNAEAMPGERPSPYALPDRETREAVFGRVPGLEAYIADLDNLDRDVLYVKARTRSLEQLKKSYPKIPDDVLESLQRALK